MPKHPYYGNDMPGYEEPTPYDIATALARRYERGSANEVLAEVEEILRTDNELSSGLGDFSLNEHETYPAFCKAVRVRFAARQAKHEEEEIIGDWEAKNLSPAKNKREPP